MASALAQDYGSESREQGTSPGTCQQVETAGLAVMEGPGERKGDSDPELPARVRGDAVN